MGFKPFLSPDWLPALYVLSCWVMCSSESWRDREQELLALEVAGARIPSSVERNLEGNLILVGLDLFRVTCYCRRNPQRPRRSRVIPWALTLQHHLSFLRILTAAGKTWLKLLRKLGWDVLVLCELLCQSVWRGKAGPSSGAAGGDGGFMGCQQQAQILLPNSAFSEGKSTG